MQSDFFADEELVGTCEDRLIAVDFDFATILSPFCSCILFAIVLVTAYHAGILSAASRAEMADVEQMNKIVPFVTCEITFGQNVCELVSGVINVSNLNFVNMINSVKTTNPKKLFGFLTHASVWDFGL